MLEVKNMSVKYGECVIVDNVSFVASENSWVMLVGPNGAGKSTIVNSIAQGVKYSGEVFIDNTDISKLKPVHLAKKIGILSQYHYVAYSFSVEEIVKLGRYSYSGGNIFSAHDKNCTASVEHALEMTGLAKFRHQSVTSLSGGELQRVFLAQIFAQDPQILILDEPTNHLDLIYQKQIFDLITEWIKQPGRLVISVVHDLNLAKAYGSDALLLNHGKLISSGKTSSVLTRENLKMVYSLDVYQWMNDMLSLWKD